MSTLANHLRITGLHLTNEDVDARSAAIKSLKTAWGKINSVDSIFLKATEVAAALSGDGTPSDALGKEVELAIQKKASAFLYSDRPLDIGIVAGMVATEIVSAPPGASGSSGWLIADVWAGALWSALGFQPSLANKKREELRMSVLEAARNRSSAGAEKARERVNVPEFGSVAFIVGAEAEFGQVIKAAAGPTVEALRRNAVLDREELDFLWWTQLRRSRLLRRPLDAIDEVARVVAAGIEGAAHLRRMPSEVHREIVLRTVTDNPSVTLSGVLANLNADRELLAAVYSAGLPLGGATLFPLLSAIIEGEAPDTPAARLDRDAEEWGARALLEASLVKLRATIPSI